MVAVFVCINSETDQQKTFNTAAEVVVEFKLGRNYLEDLVRLEVGCTITTGDWTIVKSACAP